MEPKNIAKDTDDSKFTVRLGNNLANDLKNFCDTNDKGKSEVARDAIKLYIANVSKTPLDSIMIELDMQIEEQKKELVTAQELLAKTKKLVALKAETIQTLEKTKTEIEKTL